MSCAVNAPEDLPGCTDPTAINYLPYAAIDDGSCVAYNYGCTDDQSMNYDPLANVNDGSCNQQAEGCTEPTACNYDPNATIEDGSCLMPDGCTDPIQIAIYEMSGRLVYSAEYPEGQSSLESMIDLSDFAVGLHYVVIRNGDFEEHLKLIKSK